MRNLATRGFVKYHDWRWQRRLHQDERGLTLVSYALGAAFIVVPLAIALYFFGQSASDKANNDLNSLITTGPVAP